MTSRTTKARKPRRVLIFGESENDTKALRELLVALCPELDGMVRTYRRPPLLIKDASQRAVPDRIDTIASLIDAARTDADVLCVFAHEDCDAVEPAHEALTRKIETAFSVAGFTVHAVTPAWETEAWMFLWPEAVAEYRPGWRSLDPYKGRDVGKIENAKEALTRALRPSGKASKVRDFRESDVPEIARHVRSLGLAGVPAARSASYACFRERVALCCHALGLE